MPQIIPLIKSVSGFEALNLGKLGQAVRVVDLARSLPRSIGLGSASQAIQSSLRRATPRAAYLYIGELGVDLALPDEHTIRDGASYVEHALIERKPRLQWTGSSLTDQRLSVKLHSDLCDVDAAVAWLSKILSDHAPQAVVLGSGTFLGWYVLSEFERQILSTQPSGVSYVAATISLREYVPTDDEIKKMNTPKNTPAVRKQGDVLPGLTKVENILREPSKTAVRIMKSVSL